jgi:hypothetical protein
MGTLDDWKLTKAELNEILTTRPSARGYLFGFVAEYKLSKMFFTDRRIQSLRRYDDHDRTRPGDFGFIYRGMPINVSVKSLQTASVKVAAANTYSGSCQCDASDKREITLPNGDTLATTNLVVGGFDLLAVNIFHFGTEWRFAFARNSELPRSRAKKYTDVERSYLLATSIPLTWPLSAPFRDEPFTLLDEIVAHRSIVTVRP